MGFITPSDGWDDKPSPRPPGGWDAAPLQLRQKPQTGQNAERPVQYAYLAERQPARRYLRCKICDQGALVAKKVFRMSGPAVVIGFILLIPSILGMLLSALALLGIIAVSSAGSAAAIGSATSQSAGATFDSSFRRTCLNSAARTYRQNTGASAPLPVLEGYCECTLPLVKGGYSASASARECAQRMQDGLLTVPDQETQNLYADAMAGSDHRSSQRTT